MSGHRLTYPTHLRKTPSFADSHAVYRKDDEDQADDGDRHEDAVYYRDDAHGLHVPKQVLQRPVVPRDEGNREERHVRVMGTCVGLRRILRVGKSLRRLAIGDVLNGLAIGSIGHGLIVGNALYGLIVGNILHGLIVGNTLHWLSIGNTLHWLAIRNTLYWLSIGCFLRRLLERLNRLIISIRLHRLRINDYWIYVRISISSCTLRFCRSTLLRCSSSSRISRCWSRSCLLRSDVWSTPTI